MTHVNAKNKLKSTKTKEKYQKKQDSWETTGNPDGVGGCVQRESAAGQILETEMKLNIWNKIKYQTEKFK